MWSGNRWNRDCWRQKETLRVGNLERHDSRRRRDDGYRCRRRKWIRGVRAVPAPFTGAGIAFNLSCSIKPGDQFEFEEQCGRRVRND